MLTKTFGSNSIFSITLFILMVLVLWAKVFINAVPMYAPIPVSPLYSILFNLFGDLQIVCALISVALIISEAILLNHILVENDLIPRKSYIAAFLFVIFLSFFNETIILNPVLIAGIFIISALWLTFRLYEEQEAYQHVFTISTFISIASMFYFPSIAFLFTIWSGFIIFRIFKWREWFISLLGFMWPYLLLASYYFWNDCLTAEIQAYKTVFSFINFNDYTPTNYLYIVFIFLSLITLVSIFKLLGIINEKPIRIRKSLSLLIWFFIISFIALNLSAGFGITGFLLMLISASVLFSLYISNLKQTLIGEIMLIALFIILISGRIGLWNYI